MRTEALSFGLGRGGLSFDAGGGGPPAPAGATRRARLYLPLVRAVARGVEGDLDFRPASLRFRPFRVSGGRAYGRLQCRSSAATSDPEAGRERLRERPAGRRLRRP